MKGKLLECRITQIEDLRDDIKDGVIFGGCIESNCLDDATRGAFIQVGSMEFNLLLCAQHLSQLRKMFKDKQTVLDNLEGGG